MTRRGSAKSGAPGQALRGATSIGSSECTLPLTGKAVVDSVVTDLAVLDLEADRSHTEDRVPCPRVLADAAVLRHWLM